MIKTMDMLNLKPHLCGAKRETAKKLSSAADIEGHLGTDNKVSYDNFLFIYFYLIF
jgi:hypothetical protein